MAELAYTIFGIRHHGPGSARSLQHALAEYKPDLLLIEGPPDAAEMLPLVADPGMHPPVALLIYAPDTPRQAVYYPFAEFSPEWQALQFAAKALIPARFMDLPQRFQLGSIPTIAPPDLADPEPTQPPTPDRSAPNDMHTQPEDSGADESTNLLLQPTHDPIGALAHAAGYSDGERWWEHMVEQRQSHSGLFEAILEAMAALRETQPPETSPIELQREAWMRKTLRQALSEGYQHIAIVCGAWHAPALLDISQTERDVAILAELKASEVRATWVPWTYGRLARNSGYGAGIDSPGWYEHLWQSSQRGLQATDVATHWMTRIARLLRVERIDASSAHVIEAVRLAEALAALRTRPLPGLPELSEAARAIFWSGSDLPMQLIHQQLIIGERLGEVPEATPLAPLQRDLANQQRRLRLPAEASWRDYDLDLRKPTDLERSHLLHRLMLLGVAWGQLQRSGGGKGTFHEIWRLEWRPEFAIALIEAGIWGTTISDAACAYAAELANCATDLPTLTKLVDQALLANLADAVAFLMQRIEQEAAVSSDIAHLMGALPPLANVLRYGNVRNSDTKAVAHVVEGLVTRISIGLPNACVGVNEEAAEALFGHIMSTHEAIALLERPDLQEAWFTSLQRLIARDTAHGLLVGRAVRLLLDAEWLDTAASARHLSIALSTASDPAQAAAWIEGFIRGSGSILVHDRQLWQIIDTWMLMLPTDMFVQVVPFLRRSFAAFSSPERRDLLELARNADTGTAISRTSTPSADLIDQERGMAALVVVRQLLGLHPAN